MVSHWIPGGFGISVPNEKTGICFAHGISVRGDNC